MSFAGTPLGQGRRLDHHTFLNKPQSKTTTTSPQRTTQASYAYGAPSTRSRSPSKPTSSHSQEDEPALVRYARLKQRDPNVGAPKPDRWSVKDTTVNIANAFILAADDNNMQPSASSSASMPNLNSNPNNAWASGASSSATIVPRSTSVEYEKETQSTSTRRFAPPPNRLAPPAARSTGTGMGRKPLGKQTSVRHVPDSEGEEDAPPARNERGKSPMEHLVAAAKTAMAPATFFLLQRSQEPPAPADTSANNRNDSSYDYSAEEREVQQSQSQKAASRQKKGRMSVDHKAYRPSASDLEDDDGDEDDDERKTRKRKGKKAGPAGGPLSSLPIVGQDKRKKRRSRGGGSKANVNGLEGEEEEEEESGSDEGVSEQRSASHRSAAPSRASQSRASMPRQQPTSAHDDSGTADTSMDIEAHLDSIPEHVEADGDFSMDDSPPSPTRAAVHHSAQTQSFSVGALLGKLVHFASRTFIMLVVLFGQMLGTVCDVALRRPYQWLARSGAGLGKVAVVGLTVWSAWYILQGRSAFAFADWIPSRSREGGAYRAPEVPAANIAELAARIQSIEHVLSKFSLDQEHARVRLDAEARARAEVAGRVGSLEGRVSGERERAQEAEEGVRAAVGVAVREVRKEVEGVKAQLLASGAGNSNGDGEGPRTDEEARKMLKALEERVGSVEGGVKEALEVGKQVGKVAGAASSAAWWNKLTSASGRAALTIKSTDGQDVTALIGHLVDSSVSRLRKDDLARPDFALHSAGAKVIGSLTSPSFEIRPQGVGAKVASFLSGGNGYATGRPPHTALHHELHSGHCWPFEGTEGQLAVSLRASVYVSDVTIDHVAKEVAFDLGSAPKDMEVWGMVEGADNVEKVRVWQEGKAVRRAEARERGEEEQEEPEYPKTLPTSPQYVRLASFTYDVNASKNIQTFPADEEVRALGVDFGIVVLRIKSNWGQDAFTCLYRFRVHGEGLNTTPQQVEELP